MFRSSVRCPDCRTPIPIRYRPGDPTIAVQRRQHADRCLGDLTGTAELIALDAQLELIARLYVSP